MTPPQPAEGERQPTQRRRYQTFLAQRYLVLYRYYLHCLRHLLERLGRGPALSVWQCAFDEPGDKLLHAILALGWEPAEEQAVDLAAAERDALKAQFPSPVESISGPEAHQLVVGCRPLRQIKERFSSLHVTTMITAYEGTHLRLSGIARLASALVDLHGKQGELLTYDMLLAWVAANRGPETPVHEFLPLFTERLADASRMTAGLDYQVIRATETEVVIHITRCEWARYFQDHYPRVGYLVACSLDEAEYRAANPRIRLQRTTTLMEGGPLCDFRIYALP